MASGELSCCCTPCPAPHAPEQVHASGSGRAYAPAHPWSLLPAVQIRLTPCIRPLLRRPCSACSRGHVPRHGSQRPRSTGSNLQTPARRQQRRRQRAPWPAAEAGRAAGPPLAPYLHHTKQPPPPLAVLGQRRRPGARLPGHLPHRRLRTGHGLSLRSSRWKWHGMAWMAWQMGRHAGCACLTCPGLLCSPDATCKCTCAHN